MFLHAPLNNLISNINICLTFKESISVFAQFWTNWYLVKTVIFFYVFVRSIQGYPQRMI